MQDHLIIDVGMHNGDDAGFYMHKGFRVVSIEANPTLCQRARERFDDQIKSGQLTILNIAIADEEAERDFYVNLHDDAYSSLDPKWGQREGKFETIKVRTGRFDKIIATHGTPLYLKIDIEGADLTVLRQLANVPTQSRFISVEEHALDYFPLLWALGYRGFKTVNQGIVGGIDYPGWKFQGGTSGPFGNETSGPWLPFGDAITDYMLNIRDCRNREVFTEGWYDIHATLDEPKLPEGFPYPTHRMPPRRPLVRRVLGRTKRMLVRSIRGDDDKTGLDGGFAQGLNPRWEDFRAMFGTMEAQWQLCTPISPKKLIDGTVSHDVTLMRQRVQGQWVYRKLNESEEIEWGSSIAW